MFRIPWHRLLPRHRRIVAFRILAGLGLVGLGFATPWLWGGGFSGLLTGADGRPCTLNSIHDGDTARATCPEGQVKIRLYCIDAPEIAQRPWGSESRDHLRRIAPQTVSLIAHDKDRYGRIVGEVFGHAGQSLNLALVEAGRAAVYPADCKEPRFFAAQDRAKSAQRGIWEKPGDQQRPWEWRRTGQ